MTGLYYLKKYARNPTLKRLEEGLAHYPDSGRYNRYYWDWPSYAAYAVENGVKGYLKYKDYFDGPKVTDKITNKRKTTMHPTPPKTPSRKRTRHIKGLTPNPKHPMNVFRRRHQKSRVTKPLNDRTAVSKRGKPPKTKQRRRVKVSKTFRNKVTKVLTGHTFHGFYSRYMADKLTFSNDGIQAIHVGSTSGLRSAFCAPQQIWDAFSVLWNNKTPATDQFVVTGNLNVNSGLTTSNFKGDVIKVTRTYNLRNNTHIAMTVIFYDCVAKKQLTTINNQGAEAYDEWERTLISEKNQVDALTQAGPNTGGLALGAWGTSPLSLPSFKKNWKISTSFVKLEPGQEYQYKMKQGAFTFNTRYQSNTNSSATQAVLQATYYNTIPGITRNLMMVVKPELTYDATANTIGATWPRARTYAVGPPEIQRYDPNVLISFTDKFHLACPEQTLNVIPALTGNATALQLAQETLKQDVYRTYSNYANLSAAGDAIGREDVMMPATNNEE